MKKEAKTSSTNISKRFWVLTGLGLASVFMIGLLSYFLYSILSDHLLISTKEHLSKEVQLASGDIQREFANLKNDFAYYADRIYLQDENIADESHADRLLNKYLSIVDTIYIQKGGEKLLFTLDDSDSLISNRFEADVSSLDHTNHLHTLSSSGNLVLTAKLNFKIFF